MREIKYIPGLISVIVPVYNVKNYLHRCIDSIINQTYSNLEIILIDDGSTDDSGQICDSYQDIDKRIRVFHKKNGGASSARNLGLDKARGEFIGFVDSDDYIRKDMYESLYSGMKDDVDIVCCGIVLLFPAKMRRKSELYGKAEETVCYSRQEALKELLLVRGLDFSPCNKLYRRELFQGIRFPAGKTCEDYPVIYELMKKSRNIVSNGKVRYHYCYREDSISKQQFKIRRMSYVLFTRDIMRDVAENYPKLRKCAEALYIRSVVDTISDIEECIQKERYESIQRRLRKLLLVMYGNILFNPYIPERTKKKAFRFICHRGNDTEW
ncbi:MAG: glycosyltransferase [Lachnospiraceae bacterium]|nr:glycosyltransferase [Lachnospiraceae bacterium]